MGGNFNAERSLGLPYDPAFPRRSELSTRGDGGHLLARQVVRRFIFTFQIQQNRIGPPSRRPSYEWRGAPRQTEKVEGGIKGLVYLEMMPQSTARGFR